MTADNEVKSMYSSIKKNNFKICLKENDKYIEIPVDFLNRFEDEENMINSYIRIYTNTIKIKEDINKYLFDDNSGVSAIDIGNQILRIKSEEDLDEISKYIDIDIRNLDEKFKNIIPYCEIDPQEIELLKEDVKNHYVSNSYNQDNVIDQIYLQELIDKSQNSQMYSLLTRSRYGSISKDYNVLNMEDIEDYNTNEIGGEYSPILVIYKPAKYVRGEYVLDDTYFVYIKRQPLEALIKQESLDEKGRDGMGAITYIKLKHDLTNENLQEIMAELYIHGQINNINYENIKLVDINSNKNWLTADRMKKEFKELRYYHKNLTQKLKEIYDSTSEYYTQISGKYIFNARKFMHCYNTYKKKDINV